MGGLKTICDHPGCVKKHDEETKEPLYFHPTCARQAGLEATDGGESLRGEFC